MRTHKIISAGDRVDMFTDESNILRTEIWEVLGEGEYLAAIPCSGGEQVQLQGGDEISLAFHRESGKYLTRVMVTDVVTRYGVRFAELKQVSDVEKKQRRNDYRVAVRLRVQICEYSDGMEIGLPLFFDNGTEKVFEKTETIDISSSGVAIRAMREYKPGEKYLLKLFFDGLEEKEYPLKISAEVVRTSADSETGISQVGMRFIDQTNHMTRFLTNFVQNQERRQIMNRRFFAQ